jgi:hypothetical protein
VPSSVFPVSDAHCTLLCLCICFPLSRPVGLDFSVGGCNIDQAIALTQHLLQKAGLTPLVGISRLHKHFDLAADAAIVSMLSNDRSEFTTSLRKAGELHGGVQYYIPMIWAFRDGAWQRVQVLLFPPAEKGIQGNATIDFTLLAAECEAQLDSLLSGAAGFDAAAASSACMKGVLRRRHRMLGRHCDSSTS